MAMMLAPNGLYLKKCINKDNSVCFFKTVTLLTPVVEGKSLQTIKDRNRCHQALLKDYKLVEVSMIFIMGLLSVPVIILNIYCLRIWWQPTE